MRRCDAFGGDRLAAGRDRPVGWNDNELCRFTTPSLSTVAIDRERQGREAMDRLIALIRGTEPSSPDATSLHTFVHA